MLSADDLRVVYCCTYLTTTDNPWRSEDWIASKGVKLLKGESINGYFDITLNNKSVRINNENGSIWRDKVVPKRMSEYIVKAFNPPFTIVPIPNSHVTSAASSDFRTLELAKKIAILCSGEIDVTPALVFREAQQVTSRKGGPRSPYHFEQVYEVTLAPAHPIVLLDDVMTGGGHLIGAVWKLTAKKIPVIGAITFGRSSSTAPEEVFKMHEELLSTSKTRPLF